MGPIIRRVARFVQRSTTMGPRTTVNMEGLRREVSWTHLTLWASLLPCNPGWTEKGQQFRNRRTNQVTTHHYSY
jgi:hypothetical protein